MFTVKRTVNSENDAMTEEKYQTSSLLNAVEMLDNLYKIDLECYRKAVFQHGNCDNHYHYGISYSFKIGRNVVECEIVGAAEYLEKNVFYNHIINKHKFIQY